MGTSNHLKTSSHDGVKDMSLANSGGVIERGTEPGFSTDERQGQDSAPAPIAEGPQAEGASAHKTETKAPVTANLDAQKGVSVATHPGLLAAHRHGSITHDDHQNAHAPEAKAEGPGMRTITSLASGDQKIEKGAERPVTFEMGKQAPMSSRQR